MSVRAGGAVAPALPMEARSRLDAVLAAGMARMSLQTMTVVPTDAPKRNRQDAGANDLDVLLDTEDGEIPDDLLDAFLESAQKALADADAPLRSKDVEDALAALEEEEVSNANHVLMPLLPGTDRTTLPPWIPMRLPTRMPILLPQDKGRVLENADRGKFTPGEIRYLIWWMMNPYLYNKVEKVVQKELQIKDVQVMIERRKSLKYRLTQAGVDVPTRPPMWYTVPDELPPDPPTLRPEDSSVNTPSGKDRRFTDEEKAYVYWYLFHPDRLQNKETLDQVKKDLHLSLLELQVKFKSLRHRVKVLFNLDTPPSPFQHQKQPNPHARSTNV